MAQPDWSRPHWQRDDARAMLLYFVFGAFPEQPEVDLSKHGSRGLPAGMEMRRIPKAQLGHWDGHPLRGALGEVLRADDPAAFDAARQAPECLLLRGELPDAPTLEYLGDVLGIVAALLETGGVAVVDPQILQLLSADAWRERYVDNTQPSLRDHVLVVCHDDADGGNWIRTRGLRKFARPDISIRHVPADHVEHAGMVAAQLAEMQARGMRFGDGSTVQVEGLPQGWPVARAGSLDDPDFNNTHLELDWPRE